MSTLKASKIVPLSSTLIIDSTTTTVANKLSAGGTAGDTPLAPLQVYGASTAHGASNRGTVLVSNTNNTRQLQIGVNDSSGVAWLEGWVPGLGGLTLAIQPSGGNVIIGNDILRVGNSVVGISANVGIGTNSSVCPLSIVANNNPNMIGPTAGTNYTTTTSLSQIISRNSPTATTLCVGGCDTNIIWAQVQNSDNNFYNLSLQPAGGNVAIGLPVSTPIEGKLHVKGGSVFLDGHIPGNSTSNTPLYIRYKGSGIGGTFVVFQANTNTGDSTYTNGEYGFNGDNVGSIVCNSTGLMTYNTFCGTHWSSTVDGNQDILNGTVMESVDEIHTNHLPKSRICNTPNSSSVYGVMMGTENNSICVAGLGAAFIRISANASVSVGDLLVSDQNGCAVPQSDGVIRSNTIGKVTSSVVLRTYEDGSYTVPVVLYCG